MSSKAPPARRDIHVAVPSPRSSAPPGRPRTARIWHAFGVTMGLARRLQHVALVSVLGQVCGGCIVTSSPTYSGPEACPPAFLQNEAEPPVGEIRKYDVNDSSTPFEFSASVSVRSCAVANTLPGRLFFDNNLAMAVPVIPNGSTTRTARFKLSFAGVKDYRCHKLEYLVTSEGFADTTDFRTPKKQGDLASIVWFVDVTDGPWHTLDSCPKNPTSE